MTSTVPFTLAAPEPHSLDRRLRARAQRVIPGGLWGHMDAARLPAAYPQYFARARGCRLWDVDGNEYVDFMCSYGPMILGYLDPEVERAVERQRARGDLMNGPSERLVELAELLVATLPHADWAMFAKNGTDATTMGVTIARAATGGARCSSRGARTTAPPPGARHRSPA